MTHSDFIIPFMISSGSANGRIVNLEDSITQILQQHEYPINVSNLLSELLAMSCLLGSSLKNDGLITCQIQSDDAPIKFLVAEYSYGGDIRGHAGFDKDNKNIRNAGFSELVGKSKLLVTVESGNEKYQGIIDLSAGNLTKSFEKYLEKSEQIKSLVRISTKTENNQITRCQGIILRKMPGTKHEIEEDWERFEHFINTVSEKELAETPAEILLHNLFHADEVLTYEEIKIKFQCRCNREKMEKAIEAIPMNERGTLMVDGKILVKCEFCSKIEGF